MKPTTFDYHMHTTSSDGNNSHREMVESAINKGFGEIGFSDHFCIKQPCNWAVGSNGIQALFDKIEEVRQLYDEKIDILSGIEVDYFSDSEFELAEILRQYPFDYVTGSVHFLGEWNYDSSPDGYDLYDIDFLYEWYFKELQQAAQSGLFNIMAHPDLIKKFRIWPQHPPIVLFRETARIFARSGVTFEVNTSGIDRPCGEFFPGEAFLKELYDAGVPVTLGSDSHHQTQIGRHFTEAKKMLKDFGYQSLTRFKQRVPSQFPF